LTASTPGYSGKPLVRKRVESAEPSRADAARPFASRQVVSTQLEVHRSLTATVARHLTSRWRAPIHPGSQAAYSEFRDWRDRDRPLILDSGCGTGESTLRLARRFGEAQVVGIDQSAARLARQPGPAPDNARLLRARAEDFWRLLSADNDRPARHFLLYPNPWPKPEHLKRRWPGHPAFPHLLALGGRLELRCNWRIYALEFRHAAGMCGASIPAVVGFQADSPLSPFERKYAASGHDLFRFTIHLEA